MGKRIYASDEERRLKENERRRMRYHDNPERQKKQNEAYWRRKILKELENNKNNDEVNKNE